MEIAVIPDKFKGSLTADEVCRALERGLRRSGLPGGTAVSLLPLADGGEGSLRALERPGDVRVKREVRGPSGRPVRAHYLLRDGRTALVEMAESSGLLLLPASERNPEKASSFGFGELIADAYRRGARDFILTIGGSATNDCGTGMLEALGVRFEDGAGRPLSGTGGNLSRIASVVFSGFFREVGGCRFTVACDVSNPLTGPEGAAWVFARQKGADGPMVGRLEAGAEHFAALIERMSGTDVRRIAGGGAAGGVGMALAFFLGAELVAGGTFLLRAAGAEELVARSDLVLTGEGRVDRQTLRGKLVAGVAGLAARYGKPCHVFCGRADEGVDAAALGVAGVYPLLRPGVSEAEAVGQAARLLEERAAEVFYR